MGERVRFSPSPSGELHLGGARTALFDWLVARGSGGVFIVRIEDTDAERSSADHGERILDDLEWLGLVPDESPRAGGPHAPYLQSERGAMHHETVDRLARTNHAYPCFCSPERLAREREEDRAAHRPPRYRGTCRDLSADERERRLGAGESHTWRFAVTGEGPIAFTDAVHGPVTFDRKDIGDFVIVRSDGSVTYDIACVADDVAMAVTLVLRGDDHLPNTPRQILIYEALGVDPPRFAHVPLVHAADGRPLSKSEGAMGIGELRRRGYLPRAVLNHLALIGWTDADGREIAPPNELVERFDLARVSRSAGTHDADRLDWFNAQHMRATESGLLAEEFEYLLSEFPGWLDRRALVDAVVQDVRTGAEIAAVGRSIADDPQPDEEARGILATRDAASTLEAVAASIENSVGEDRRPLSVQSVLAELGVAPRIGMPMVRAALMGRAHGPRVDRIIELLGVERAVRRLRSAAGFDIAEEGGR